MLKFGLCGGGIGSFIGSVHLRGIEATHKAKLVAGCFSRNAERNKEAAEEYGAEDRSRLYSSTLEMAKMEGSREDGIDFVVIATPNMDHYETTKAFLEAGINVALDKPVTTEEWQAIELQKLAKKKGLLFCVTFTYAGYPVLQHAREIIRRGDLGDIRVVMGEYAQDWLAGNNGVNPWRTDPAVTGRMNSIGDIGSHIMFTIDFLTGLEIDDVCCQLDNFGVCQTDTNTSVLMKYKNGATGMYWASQIAHGNDNGSRFRIYGSKGSIEWSNDEPEVFKMTIQGEPTMIISKGRKYTSPYSSKSRLPAGHQEGWYYVFANLYDPFLAALENKSGGYYPTIDEGVRVAHWMEACYESNQKKAWVKL